MRTSFQTPEMQRVAAVLTQAGVSVSEAQAYARALREMTGEEDMKDMTPADIIADYQLKDTP